MPSAFITGATGFVGSHLVNNLIKKNYRVTCLVRKTSNLQWLKGLDINFAYGSLNDIKAIENAVKDIDYVFHVAGLIKAISPKEFYNVNAKGTENVLNACLNVCKNLKKFVLVSSLAAAGPSDDGVPVNENTHPNPVSDYGKSKLEGEKILKMHAGNLKFVIIRPPVVYGPRDTGLLPLFKIIKSGIKFTLGKNRMLSIVSVYDLVEGIILAAESENSTGKTYFVCNNEPTTYEQAVSLIAESLGTKGIWIWIPDRVIQFVSNIIEILAKNINSPVIFDTGKAIEIRQKYWVCSNELAKIELGFRQKVPLKEGIAETIRWYKENKWL